MELEQEILERAKNQTAAQRKKLEDQKYQERLPWESKHISPYIPKLDKIGFKNDYYLPETYNYELIKSFQPFFQSQINPIRQGQEDYTEYIKNLDEEEQARFTMDKFREFLAEKSKPQLSTESGLMSMRYRNRLLNILDLYQQGKLSSVKALQNLNSIQQLSNNPNQGAAAPAINSSYFNPQQGASAQSQVNIQPVNQYQNNVFQTNPPIQQQYQIQQNNYQSPTKNLGSAATRPLSQQVSNMPMNQISVNPSQYLQAQQLQNLQVYQSDALQDSLMRGSQLSQQQKYQQMFNQNQQLQQQQVALFSKNDIFNKQLHYDYERILHSEGKLKQGQDGQSWNTTSESYLNKLQEWDNDTDNWIQDQLLMNKHVQTQFFLQPRVYRQVRPIDKVKRDVIKTVDGQLIPYESIIERRSIEIMHQRDFLVRPSLQPNSVGELEVVHDVFSYDRSFIVEQNPLTKSEILHEYPIHLNGDQFFDFLFQTGIDVKRMDYFIQQPMNQTQQTAQFYQYNINPQMLEQQAQQYGANSSPTSLQNIPTRTKHKKNTKKLNIQDKVQTLNQENQRKEELKKYFLEDQKQQQKKNSNLIENFDYNGSKINFANQRDSQVSFDQEFKVFRNM